MQAPQECPLREQLREFALGLSSEADATEIADHLDECEFCEQSVDNMKLSDDAIIGAILHPQVVDSYAEEPDCRRVESIVLNIGRELSQNTRRTGAEANQLLFTQIGPYQLLEKIGSGGMGTVYKAIHRKLDKVLALKVLTKSRTQDPSAVARFEREVRAAGKLDHPHIVRATDAGEIDGTHFLVMELVDGLDLATIVKHHKRLPIPEACEAIREAALGLQEAHRNGMVHRDIKPSNLMLARSPRSEEAPVVKLLDLGLARLTTDALSETTELTSENHVVGTIDYMAPEQLADTHGADIRADVYSLGASLYKLLSGEAPYPTSRYKTNLAKLSALSHADIEPVQHLRPEIPTGLAVIVMRLLARNPADRYATPQEVVAALQPFCQGHNLNRLWPEATTSSDAMTIDAEQSTRCSFHAQTNNTTPQITLLGATAAIPDRPTSPRSIFSQFGLWIGSLLTLLTFLVISISQQDLAKQEINEPSKSNLTQSPQATDERPIQASLPDPVRSTISASSANRRAVEWVLNIGGAVVVTQNEQLRPLYSIEDLPPANYSLEIDLRQNPRVDDAGLEQLRGATGIRSLVINDTKISNLDPVTSLSNLENLSCCIHLLDADDLRMLLPLKSLRKLSIGAFPPSLATSPEKTLEAFRVACLFSQIDALSFGSFCHPLDNSSLRELKLMPQLISLHVGSSLITDYGLSEMPSLPQLTSLSFGCPQITGNGLAGLNKYPKLEFLTLLNSSISDDDLKLIPKLPNLQIMHLRHRRELTGVGFSSFEASPQLTSLSLNDTGISDDGVQTICSAAPRLSLLSFIDCQLITNSGISHLKNLKHLSNLSLSGCNKITDDAVADLIQIPSLSTLDLSRTGMTPKSVVAIRQALPKVTVVGVPPESKLNKDNPNRRAAEWALSVGAKVTVLRGKQVRTIASADELPDEDYSLEMDFTKNLKVDDAGMKNLRDATAITMLNLQGTKVTQLAPLTTLPRLETLRLAGLPIAALELESLKRVSSLRTLSIGDRNVSLSGPEANDATLQVVAQLSQLTMLDFGGPRSPFTNDGVTALRQMTQLNGLKLSSSHLTDDGLAFLEVLPRLNELSLEMRLTKRGFEHLKGLTSLKRLTFFSMSLSEEEFTALPTLPKLEQVNFVYCPAITGTQASHLSRFPTLTSLGLHGSGVTDAGLREIATFIPQLKYLTLADVQTVTSKGLQPLSEMQSLATLSVIGCQKITDDAVPYLAAIPGLVNVHVSRTSMTADGVNELRKQRPSLKIIE